ncbi:uncharacterized protein N7500_004506 [Penicillium coprophilum]|uniref:uncharacterized protein n=1 Tax=Penicillium coprophilum TaxID=36646 RepID=UPI002387E0BF|nr:uncharacterized protein N7500_004506 [Penicillium coprophilum]KAJ5162676.1 hypothetical protein N7500_004506 [Penicillium coprophilum]
MAILPLANGVNISHEDDHFSKSRASIPSHFLGASLGEKSDYREARRKSENEIRTDDLGNVRERLPF